MTNVRRKGTFRAQAAERSGRAAQATPLPPRCRRCRLPGVYSEIVDDVAEFFCSDKHAPAEDEWECGVSEDHSWKPGDYECRRCGADLSEWNEEEK